MDRKIIDSMVIRVTKHILVVARGAGLEGVGLGRMSVKVP